MMTLKYRNIEQPNYYYLGGQQRKMQRACDRILKQMRKNPPNMKGWLKGGIDVQRMKQLKWEIENDRS